MNNDTVTLKSITIDDKEYAIINEKDYNNNHYLYLFNVNDEKDIIIRKLVDNNIVLLDSDEEVIDVLKQFNNSF